MKTPRSLSFGDILGFVLIGLLLSGAMVWIAWGVSTFPKRSPLPSPHVGKVVASASNVAGVVLVRFTDGTEMRVRNFGRKLVMD